MGGGGVAKVCTVLRPYMYVYTYLFSSEFPPIANPLPHPQGVSYFIEKWYKWDKLFEQKRVALMQTNEKFGFFKLLSSCLNTKIPVLFE